MTVRELQEILDKIIDKNAPIEFNVRDYKNPTKDDIPEAIMKIEIIQDDSYFRDEGDKVVFIDFCSPQIKIDDVNEKELENFYKKDIPIFLCGALDKEWTR
jgi:hypothetical protein